MAGHAAGDGIDGELHIHAAASQHVVQLAELVLGLRHRQAVAGNDDHRARGIEDLRGVFRAGAVNGALFVRAAGRGLDLAEGAE